MNMKVDMDKDMNLGMDMDNDRDMDMVMDMYLDLDLDMDMDTNIDKDIQRFRCQISDIGKKLNPISDVMSSVRYWRLRYPAQSDIVHHGHRNKCGLWV
jgi:hypothetical protein